MEGTLFQVGQAVFVAILTAWVTVSLSLRRFYREKWWEAKMNAYTALVQALHDMKRDLEISIPAEYEGRDTNTEFHKKWNDKHAAAWDEIRKDIDVGEFLFSDNSVRILQKLVDDSESEPDDMYIDHLERVQGAVETCLPSIKAAAKEDLQLRSLRSRLMFWSVPK